MEQKKLIKKILAIELKETRKYTPMLCLRSGRNLLKYSINEYDDYYANNYSALLNYLVFLEMVGTVFKPIQSKTLNSNNGIYKALKYFGENLDHQEISSIRALRNSLAHNFGLAIKSNTKNEDLTHKFELHFDTQSDKIITLPKEKWNGCFSDKQEETSTIVNEKNLIQLIENIYQKLLDMNEKGELELAICEDELNTRFSIMPKN